MDVPIWTIFRMKIDKANHNKNCNYFY